MPDINVDEKNDFAAFAKDVAMKAQGATKKEREDILRDELVKRFVKYYGQPNSHNQEDPKQALGEVITEAQQKPRLKKFLLSVIDGALKALDDQPANQTKTPITQDEPLEKSISKMGVLESIAFLAELTKQTPKTQLRETIGAFSKHINIDVCKKLCSAQYQETLKKFCGLQVKDIVLVECSARQIAEMIAKENPGKPLPRIDTRIAHQSMEESRRSAANGRC